jgi:hypothetical protein
VTACSAKELFDWVKAMQPHADCLCSRWEDAFFVVCCMPADAAISVMKCGAFFVSRVPECALSEEMHLITGESRAD